MKRLYVVCVREKYDKEYYPILTADSRKQAEMLYEKWKEAVSNYPWGTAWIAEDYFIINVPHNSIDSWVLDDDYDVQHIEELSHKK